MNPTQKSRASLRGPIDAFCRSCIYDPRLKARLIGLLGWRRAAAAALLGAAATAALPPLHVLPLAVVAFSGLLWLVDGSRSRRASFLVGWWFGLGHFVSGLYWFAHALLTDAERFAWLIAPAILGASAFLAVFPALATAAARLFPSGARRALGLALAWVAAEWLRGRVLSGFPWNLVGYSWTISNEMLQLAALTGIYGLSLVTVLAAAQLILNDPHQGRDAPASPLQFVMREPPMRLKRFMVTPLHHGEAFLPCLLEHGSKRAIRILMGR